MIQCLRRGSNRNMKKTILLAPLLLSLIMISTIMLPVSATDLTRIGVKVGDTADYTFSNPTANGTLATGRFRIHILGINGTIVTIDLRSVYLNNSEGRDNIITGDVSSGDNPIFPYLIPADLGQGDYIDNLVMWVDRTTTMIVAGQNRIVNHFDGITSLPMIPAGVNWTWSNDVYYDKLTGLLVKWNWTLAGYFSPYPNGTKVSYIKMLTSTTAFDASASSTLSPEDKAIALPVITAAIAFIAVIIAAAVITQQRKLRTTRS
jgi:hypothetical protein